MPGGYERIEASQGYHDDLSDCLALSMTICHQRQACNSFLAPVIKADGRVMSRADALLEGFQELFLEMGWSRPSLPPGSPWGRQ